MADDQERILGERLGRIEQRVGSLEESAKGRRGPLAVIKTLAIIVGFLGGLVGGTSTILQLRHDLSAAPKIVMEPGTQLRMDWNAADQFIDFKCLLRLTNNGDADGKLDTFRAHVERCDGSNAHFSVGKVQAVQQTTVNDFARAVVMLPLTIGKRSSRDIELTMSSDKIARFEDVFGIDKPYQLVIELDPADIQPRGQAYSFALGSSAIARLTGRERSYSSSAVDPRCQAKEKV